MRLALASFLDRQESRLRYVAERLGYAPWLSEFRTYLGDPRLTLEEFFVRYTLLRQKESPRLDAVNGEAAARAFYAESDYLLWRQVVHRRHSAWRRVLWTMRGTTGSLLELGCGIAPVSAWVERRKPDWQYGLCDIEVSAHHQFAD